MPRDVRELVALVFPTAAETTRNKDQKIDSRMEMSFGEDSERYIQWKTESEIQKLLTTEKHGKRQWKMDTEEQQKKAGPRDGAWNHFVYFQFRSL